MRSRYYWPEQLENNQLLRSVGDRFHRFVKISMLKVKRSVGVKMFPVFENEESFLSYNEEGLSWFPAEVGDYNIDL